MQKSVAKVYLFRTKIYAKGVKPFDWEKRDELKKTSPFLSLLRRRSLRPYGITRFSGGVAHECQVDGRGCLVFQLLQGDIRATSISDALKKINAIRGYSKLDYLQLDDFELVKDPNFTYANVARSYLWDDGRLTRTNHVANKVAQVTRSTRLYALFKAALRKEP